MTAAQRLACRARLLGATRKPSTIRFRRRCSSRSRRSSVPRPSSASISIARRDIWRASSSLPDALAARALILYHLAEQRPMMGAFLDALGIAHENGLIKEDRSSRTPAKLAPAAASSPEQFPAEDVSLYLTTLLCQDPETWGGLTEIVQSARRRPARGRTAASRSKANGLTMRKPVILITGAGGEIGHGLVTRLADVGSRDHHARRDAARRDAGAARAPRVHRIDYRHQPARSHARRVRGRSRLSPRRAALDAGRVHAGRPRTTSTSRARSTCSSSRSGRASRTAGRSCSSIRRRSRRTGCRDLDDEDARRAASARTSSRTRRRCTGATSCTASSSAATTPGTTSSCRPT